METLKLSEYLKRGLKLARPEIPLFLLALCCVVGTASINLFLPNFQGKILDHVIEGRAACVLPPPPPPPHLSPLFSSPPPAAAALVAAMMVEAEPNATMWTAATASAVTASASRLLAETSSTSDSTSASASAPTSTSASASASASPPPPPPPPSPPPTPSAECVQKRGLFLETVTMYLALSIATGALGGLRALCFNLVGRRIMVWVRCRLFKR